MKKEIISLILVPIILTACSNHKSGTEIKYEKAEKVSTNFSSDYEKCKIKDYVNLDFSNCSAKLPQFNSCNNLKVTVQCEPKPMGDEMYQNFEKYCEFFCGDYNSENALFSSSSESIIYNQNEDDGKYAWYPKVNDYIEQIQNGSIETDSFLYRDIVNSKYLWWNKTTHFPHWISKGEAYELIKTDTTKISSWIPSDMDNKIVRYFNDGKNNEKSYALLDGDVPIGEAVNYFENEYLTSLPYTITEDYSINVSSIDVYNIKDNLYGYVFNFSSAWNTIPFDSREETFSYEDTSLQYLISGEALMINKDDIDTIVDFNFPDIQEVGGAIEDICSLENAVDIMSDKLTQNVKFDLQTIEFVYRGDYSSDYSTAYLEPSWKFIAYNQNDNLYYCIYVNAVSGECNYISYSPLEG